MSKDPRVQGPKVTRVQGSMAQAAKLSMHPSSGITKIGMHANTFLVESFKWWSIASGAVRCSCFPFCSTCLVQSSRASFICFVRSFCTDVLNKLCEADTPLPPPPPSYSHPPSPLSHLSPPRPISCQVLLRNTTKPTLATHRLSTHRPACYMLTLLLPGHTQHMRCVRTMALLLVGVLLP